MRRLIALSVVLAFVAIACGVPGPGEMESIDPQQVPFFLATTSTTSTTTTTTTTTIPQPTTTEVPLSTTTTIEPTTTTPAATEPVDLYFVSGDRLFRISASLAADADPRLILAALLEGPDAYEVPGLRSAIPCTACLTVTVSGGVARVDVPPNLLDEMSNDDLRLMFGQIVLTLTSPRCLGQVQFTFGGEEQAVFLGDSSPSEPGQRLSCVDYDALVSSDAGPAVTTTTSTTTTQVASNSPTATTVAPVDTTLTP